MTRTFIGLRADEYCNFRSSIVVKLLNSTFPTLGIDHF